METEYRIDGDERNINVVNNDGNEDNTSIIDDTAGSVALSGQNIS